MPDIRLPAASPDREPKDFQRKGAAAARPSKAADVEFIARVYCWPKFRILILSVKQRSPNFMLPSSMTSRPQEQYSDVSVASPLTAAAVVGLPRMNALGAPDV